MKIGARIHENDKIGNSTNEVLATYKYLNMDEVIYQAIETVKEIENVKKDN